MATIRTYFKTIHSVILRGHSITNSVNTSLKPLGITEPQYNVLRSLHEEDGPLSVQDLQSRMIQKNSNVTRIVDKLLDKGWVNRELCSDNRRKVHVTLNDLGRSKLKVFDQVVYELHKPSIGKLTDEELTQLEFLLNKLTHDK